MEAKRAVQEPYQELPDELLASEIFSRLPLPTLLSIRRTCRQWNRLVLSDKRILQGTDLRKCLVKTFRREGEDPAGGWFALAHQPLTGEWYSGPIPWLARPELDGYHRAELMEAEGPFLLYHIIRKWSRADRYIVQNPLTSSHRLLPEPQPDCMPRPRRQFDVFRSAKLIPGTSGKFADYRAVLVTVVVPKGYSGAKGVFYTHLYCRETDSWRFITCVQMENDDVWSDTRRWVPLADCFDGRFVYFSFHVYGVPVIPRKLWAFDTVLETWKHICTKVLEARQPKDSLCYGRLRTEYVACLGKLIALSADYSSCQQIIYEYSEEGGTGSWRQLCVKKFKEHIWRWSTRSRQRYPVVNQCIFFCPVFSDRSIFVYDLYQKSWECVPVPHNQPSEIAEIPFIGMTPSRHAVP